MTFSHYAFRKCIACQDPDNAPLPGQEHPFFDLTYFDEPVCFFQCPDDYVVNNANHVCQEIPPSNLKTIIISVVVVAVFLGIIGAVVCWCYCKYKEKQRLREEREERRRKKKEELKLQKEKEEANFEVKVEEGVNEPLKDTGSEPLKTPEVKKE
jgi:hypothetical protein